MHGKSCRTEQILKLCHFFGILQLADGVTRPHQYGQYDRLCQVAQKWGFPGEWGISNSKRKPALISTPIIFYMAQKLHADNGKDDILSYLHVCNFLSDRW